RREPRDRHGAGRAGVVRPHAGSLRDPRRRVAQSGERGALPGGTDGRTARTHRVRHHRSRAGQGRGPYVVGDVAARGEHPADHVAGRRAAAVVLAHQTAGVVEVRRGRGIRVIPTIFVGAVSAGGPPWATAAT